MGAAYSVDGNKTTYTFSSLTNENPQAGVPGLVKYCVYTTPQPGTITSATTFKTAKGSNNFAFGRPGGNKTNIPLDGKTTTMGSATWSGTAPASQDILLHINDPAVCASLYGGTPGTCFVKPFAGPTAPVCDAGDTSLAYNAFPFGVVNCVPSSLGFQAQRANEFGDGVGLAGSARILDNLQVVFVSYACSVSGQWNNADCVTAAGATFNQRITAKIYSSDLSTVLATATQTFAIPYRPSADPSCPAANGNPAGARWVNPATGLCQNSILKVLTFTNWTTSPVTLPDDVVWTVQFNTSSSGYNPVGACNSTPDCAYDSLNVGAKSYPNAPYAGTDTVEDLAYISTQTSPLLQTDTGWTGFRPLGAIKTK